MTENQRTKVTKYGRTNPLHRHVLGRNAGCPRKGRAPHEWPKDWKISKRWLPRCATLWGPKHKRTAGRTSQFSEGGRHYRLKTTRTRSTMTSHYVQSTVNPDTPHHLQERRLSAVPPDTSVAPHTGKHAAGTQGALGGTAHDTTTHLTPQMEISRHQDILLPYIGKLISWTKH